MSAKIQDVEKIWDARVERLGEYATDRIGSTIEEKDAERVQRFEFIKKHLWGRPSNVIDYGCGSGLMCELFNHVDYLGLDVSQKMIALARNKNPGYLFMPIQMDIGLDITFQKKNIFIATVLQHNELETVDHIVSCCTGAEAVILYENTDSSLKDTDNIAYRPPDWYMQKVFDWTEKEPVDIISHTIHNQKHSLMIFR